MSKFAMQNAVYEALHVALSDFLVDVQIIKQDNDGSYDPSTGTVTRNETIIETRGLMDGFTQEDMGQFEVAAADLKLIIALRDLTNFSISRHDHVVIDGRRWEIIDARVEHDAIATIQVRDGTRT